VIASLSFETSDLDHFQPFAKKGLPVVFFDRVEQDGDHTVVIIDNFKCGYIATEHLIEQGCKRIVHVTSSLKRNVYDQRYKGYRAALQHYKIPFDDSLLQIHDLSEKAGMDAAHIILGMKRKPDGIFFSNDYVAAVAIRSLKEKGIRVPEDIAVVGFNNDTIGKLIEPSLTTINYPGLDMGEIAASNLIAHLKGKSNLKQTKTIIVRSELIVRKSSLKKGIN
jgi:LacI family transcriptional regulator